MQVIFVHVLEQYFVLMIEQIILMIILELIVDYGTMKLILNHFPP